MWLETLSFTCSSFGRSKPAVDAAWHFKKYLLGLAALSERAEWVMCLYSGMWVM